MKVGAWPFLVGRNRALGYQAIVSPQFLSEYTLSYLLARATGGDESPLSSATIREIHGTKVGNFSIIFRVLRAQEQDYGLGGSDVLRDKGGRPILLIEGLVIQGGSDQIQDIVLTQEDFQMAHTRVEEAYRAFWSADEAFTEWVSSPFDLQATSNAQDQITVTVVPPLEVSPPSKTKQALRTRAPGWQRPAIVAALICIVLLAVTLFNLPHPPTPEESLDAFCKGLQKQDYSLSYTQLSDNLRKSITLPAFSNLFAADGQHVTGCKEHVDASNDSAANATIELTFAGGGPPDSLKLQLTKDTTGAWKISDLPIPIHQ